MDKQKLKTFAIESRRKLIEDVTYQANLLGVSADGINEPFETADGMQAFDIGAGKPYKIYDEDIKRRESLINEVKDKGFDNVMEEVAYTWFNRIIAIRYMELHNYLPTHVRVLSSEIEGKNEPDIITESPNIDLDFTQEDKELIYKLKDENSLDELFQFLFIKQCNKLNEILPGLFEKTEDYMEILLNLSYTSEEGMIYTLLNDLSEEDFNEVEIIGWMYQYYIQEKKDLTNDINKRQMPKEDLPAVTQIFTPDWIVQYMVDNSLGRYWIKRNPHSSLKNHLQFYIDEAEQDKEVSQILKEIRKDNIKIRDVKFFDPCMGSGHILVYAFDVLVEIYNELGYAKREIPSLILENNLYGLDIDDRAYQLAYFAILMKAREHDNKIFNKEIKLNLCAIQETNPITNELITFINKYDSDFASDVSYLKELFMDGKEFGSLIQVKSLNYNELYNSYNNLLNNVTSSISDIKFKNLLKTYVYPLIKQAEILSGKYDCVVTNPPYMNKFNKNYKNFVKENYKDYSKDLFSIFIYHNFDFCKKEGYSAFMTPLVWMYINSYEKIRKYIIEDKNFISLIELEYSALSSLGATVPVCTFVLSNNKINDYKSTFFKLSNFTGGLEVQKEKTLNAINQEVDYKFNSSPENFEEIPGSPIAYWASENAINAFNIGDSLEKLGDVKQGLATADNNRFLRFWYEVNYENIGLGYSSINNAKSSGLKWFPYNKGGSFRKWYGNQDYIVNWKNDGFEIRNMRSTNGKIKSRAQNTQFYFKPSLSWSKISSSDIAFRMFPAGFLFDVAGCSIFLDDNFKYVLGFLNSSISQTLLDLISPTLNYEVGHVASLPLIFDDSKKNDIVSLVNENINICKDDWDYYEISWNFSKNPLLKFNENLLSSSFDDWAEYKDNQFELLKSNEVKLNKIFSDIYSIDSDCDVDDNHVSVNKANYVNDIKSFISYVIGNMFGRYNLNDNGLICTSNNFNIDDYSKFIPDVDNIVPITDREYFDDDIVGRFVEFVRVSFGEEHLEENLDFIAGALKKSGGSSRDIIRNYFLKDFFNDHKKMYKSCPIYWLFDSGKENGFKCLIYMHRYTSDLVARVRTDYLHKTQKAIESQIDYQIGVKEHSSNSKDKSRADKQIKLLTKQLNETKIYDEALAHVASQNIELDLDDGVKVNYAKFQGVEVSHEGQKTRKINLLKKL